MVVSTVRSVVAWWSAQYDQWGCRVPWNACSENNAQDEELKEHKCVHVVAPVHTSIYAAAGIPAQYDHLQFSEQHMPDVLSKRCSRTLPNTANVKRLRMKDL